MHLRAWEREQSIEGRGGFGGKWWVGLESSLIGVRVWRNAVGEPHARRCMGLKEVLDTEDVCFRIKQLRNIVRVI
jgi:hypothetical protein